MVVSCVCSCTIIIYVIFRGYMIIYEIWIHQFTTVIMFQRQGLELFNLNMYMRIFPLKTKRQSPAFTDCLLKRKNFSSEYLNIEIAGKSHLKPQGKAKKI